MSIMTPPTLYLIRSSQHPQDSPFPNLRFNDSTHGALEISAVRPPSSPADVLVHFESHFLSQHPRANLLSKHAHRFPSFGVMDSLAKSPSLQQNRSSKSDPTTPRSVGAIESRSRHCHRRRLTQRKNRTEIVAFVLSPSYLVVLTMIVAIFHS